MAARKKSDDDRLMVTLTVPQLRAIVREEVTAALRQFAGTEHVAPISEEERARARKRMGDLIAGRR